MSAVGPLRFHNPPPPPPPPPHSPHHHRQSLPHPVVFKTLLIFILASLLLFLTILLLLVLFLVPSSTDECSYIMARPLHTHVYAGTECCTKPGQGHCTYMIDQTNKICTLCSSTIQQNRYHNNVPMAGPMARFAISVRYKC